MLALVATFFVSRYMPRDRLMRSPGFGRESFPSAVRWLGCGARRAPFRFDLDQMPCRP